MNLDGTGVPPAGFEHLIRDAVPAALGALLRQGAQFADAEDAVQEAVEIALAKWPQGGVPDRSVGWLVRVAGRRLIARHRTESARQRRETLIASWSSRPADPVASDDDSLLLLFLCCHPGLRPASAIPLTLRAVGGLTTREIADALLVPEATVAQRISRAKATIGSTAGPFVRPGPGEIAARLPAVLQIISLIFTEGHSATSGPDLTRADLAEEAIHLARRLHERLPDHPEVDGLLALLLLTDARRTARTGPAGELIPLDQQDRTLWNRPMISEGLRLLTAAFGHHELGEYQLRAAVAAVHDQASAYSETNWVELRALYNRLARLGDNPMVMLNRAIAVAHTDGPEPAIAEVVSLTSQLGNHHRYHATMGYLHELTGDRESARRAYATAAGLATNEPERLHLARKSRG